MFEAADAEAIEREISGLAAVAPAASRGTQAIYGNQNWSTSVTGTTSAFLKVRDWPLGSRKSLHRWRYAGRQGGVHSWGHSLRQAFRKTGFPGGRNPSGEDLSFKVAGVLTSKGQSTFGTDQDDLVIIPLRAFQRRFAGNTDVNVIYVSARDGVSTEKVQQDIERLMRERRRITAGKEDDFNVRDMQEIVDALQPGPPAF